MDNAKKYLLNTAVFFFQNTAAVRERLELEGVANVQAKSARRHAEAG